MKVEDLRKKDKFGAFDDFLGTAEAKKDGTIPEDFVEYFPDVCECGSDMIVSKELTRIMCCDPRCPIKLSHSLEHMLGKFNCKNVGIQMCKKIVFYAYDKLENKSHLDVFSLEDKDLTRDLGTMAFVYFKQAMYKIRNSPLTFSEMVSRLAIPEFDSTASKLFSNVPNMAKFVDIIKLDGGVKKYLNNRGVFDKMKSFYLSEFLIDIAIAESKVFRMLRPPGEIELNVCITGNLAINKNRVTKAEFVEICNELGNIGGTRLFDIKQTTAIKSVQFVIADYPSTTNKYLIAKQREQEEGRKILHTADEFIEYLKEVVSCVTERTTS